ncbi:MAG: hypothetical protein ACT443_13615 [Gemmatimonadota bacterium]
MATVHLAEDLKHNRKVALKVLRPELAAALGKDRSLPRSASPPISSIRISCADTTGAAVIVEVTQEGAPTDRDLHDQHHDELSVG